MVAIVARLVKDGHASLNTCALQVLSDILETCGDNIDAAIKRLGDLRLTANCSAAALDEAAQPAAVPSKASSKAGGSSRRALCEACLLTLAWLWHTAC